MPNLTLLPLQNDEAYREMMADTDLALITQQPGTGQYFFPSKLLSALAFARPVLAVADADSELALALGEGGFGLLSPPGDAAALAAVLDRAAAMDGAQWRALGEAGRRYVERFEWANVLAEFERTLRAICLLISLLHRGRAARPHFALPTVAFRRHASCPWRQAPTFPKSVILPQAHTPTDAALSLGDVHRRDDSAADDRAGYADQSALLSFGRGC